MPVAKDTGGVLKNDKRKYKTLEDATFAILHNHSQFRITIYYFREKIWNAAVIAEMPAVAIT